jgi:hypothetical protein
LRRFLAGAAGVTAPAAASLSLAAVAIGAVTQTHLPPKLVAKSVCILEAVHPARGGTCEEGGGPARGKPPFGLLHRAQYRDPLKRPRPVGPNRREIAGPLLLHESWLREFFGGAQRSLGIVAPRPRVTLDAPRGGAPRLPYLVQPPRAGDAPDIHLFVPDSGNPDRELVGAIFALAHLFARAAQHSSNLRYRPDDPRLTSHVTTWRCQGDDCRRLRAVVLHADCMAGAYIGRAYQWGRIDALTISRMEQLIATTQPSADDERSGFPDGAERLRWLTHGLNSQYARRNPYACFEANLAPSPGTGYIPPHRPVKTIPIYPKGPPGR